MNHLPSSVKKTISLLWLLPLSLALLCLNCHPPTTAVDQLKPTVSPVRTTSSISETEPIIPREWPYQIKNEIKGQHGMVVTDAILASRVGSNILAKGGNAVDATIATAFALSVVHPAAGNLGGGGFLVARINNKSYSLDFRETAPAKATRDLFLRAENAGLDSVSSHRAAGVPGSVAGLWAAYQRLGSRKIAWRDLVDPAIQLAQEGFVMDEVFVKRIQENKDKLQKNAASKALYFPSGVAPKVGDIFRNPDLAKTLQLIAEKGAAGFYEGKTADLIAEEMSAHQGLIGRADLKLYQAKWREPLQFAYHDHHIISMPPPSSGGMTLAMICHILEPYSLEQLKWHSWKHLHLQFEAMRRAFIARNSALGDPDYVKIPTEILLSEAWAEKQRSTIDSDKATPTLDLVSQIPNGNDGPHTTHFSIVDAQGNAVAMTTTLNFWFGSGITVSGAGFVLNSEMDDFATDPGKPNGFGLVQGESNAIAPGKRMLSSMTPTLVLDPTGKVVLVTGAAGGPTIITTVFQIISNVLDFHFEPDLAGRAPRIHMQDFPDQVLYEKNGLPSKLKDYLEKIGYQFQEKDHIADAPTIGRQGQDFIGVPEARTTSSGAAGW